ncbi:MAG: hypothetical protein PVI78_02780 [Anaerolineales bacterium]
MPSIFDPETIYVDDLPTVWSPVQEKLSPDEHAQELEEQATASLLWASPVPEQILRILLDETSIQRLDDPPEGYDPEIQGEWDALLLAFGFKRGIQLLKEARTPERLVLEYKLEGAGYWLLEIAQETVTIERI